MFQKKFLPYLLGAALGILALVVYILAINPDEDFNVYAISVSPIPFLFLLVFLATSSLFTFLLRNVRRGILCGSFVVGVLLLQFFNYTNILYSVLLFIIFLLIEFLFFSKK